MTPERIAELRKATQNVAREHFDVEEVTELLDALELALHDSLGGEDRVAEIAQLAQPVDDDTAYFQVRGYKIQDIGGGRKILWVNREEVARKLAQLSEPRRVVPELEKYPGEREHVAFVGALKYELDNPTPSQAPTSFDINRDFFEHYANVFTKDNERMAHGVGFLNGARWHQEHHSIPADRVLKDWEVAVRVREWNAMQAVISCAEHLLSWYEPLNASRLSNEKRHELHVAVEELNLLRTTQAKGVEG